MGDEPIYYSKEMIDMLKAQLLVSSPVLHKIMNPFCGQCMAERGQQVLEHGWSWEKKNEQQP